jgi:hypothetical protein
MIQNTSPPWPRLVHDAITSLFGKPIRVHSLGGGQSQANVWKVQFPARSVIVKRTKQPRERLFYTTIAPLLQEARIPVPHLEWSDVVADDHSHSKARLRRNERLIFPEHTPTSAL